MQFLSLDTHIYSCGSLLALWTATRLLNPVPLETQLALTATFVARTAVHPTLNARREPSVLILRAVLLVPLLDSSGVRSIQARLRLWAARSIIYAGMFYIDIVILARFTNRALPFCSHGNCYNSNAVCCDNPGTRCTIGSLCGACSPGQTCGNNGVCLSNNPTTATRAPTPPATSTSSTSRLSTTLVSHSSAQSSTSLTVSSSSTSRSSSPTVEIPISTTVLSTTFSSATMASSFSTLATPTPTAQSSSTASASPTTVAQVDSFSLLGCFSDSANAPILVADSLNDSTTSMTVEKCVAFAQQNAWRYAGVESGRSVYALQVSAKLIST